MKPVIGVDGCRFGWIAVIWGERLEHRLVQRFEEILQWEGEIIAVDMPIGFLDIDRAGGRDAEQELRRYLGRKSSSVFPTPARATVEANPQDHPEAIRINRANSDPPKSLTAQCFNILRKMTELDRLMTSQLQRRVHECHPEASFAQMNGGTPLMTSKKSWEGHQLRRRALEENRFPLKQLPPVSYKKSDVAPDDLIDACACAWSARRILEGRARRFPENPPLDSRGLRMEINA